MAGPVNPVADTREILNKGINDFLDNVPDLKSLDVTPEAKNILKNNSEVLRKFTAGKRTFSSMGAEDMQEMLCQIERAIKEALNKVKEDMAKAGVATAEQQRKFDELNAKVAALNTSLQGTGGIFEKTQELKTAIQKRDNDAPIIGGVRLLETASGNALAISKDNTIMGIPPKKLFFQEHASDNAFKEAVDKFVERHGKGAKASYAPQIDMAKFRKPGWGALHSNKYRKSVINRLCLMFEKGLDVSKDFNRLIQEGQLSKQELKQLQKAQLQGHLKVMEHKGSQNKLSTGAELGAKLGSVQENKEGIKLSAKP